MALENISTIFHPSDFSYPSRVAFEHALKLALMLKADLRIMHVSDDRPTEWHDFPGVRETLVQWKLLPEGSPKSAVVQLGIDVQKIIARDSEPVRACLHELNKNPADLIVLATSQHQGRMAWLDRSIAEPIARGAQTMSLFIPHDSKGFVNSDDGSMRLRSILVPVTNDPSPVAALSAVARFTALIGQGPGTVTTLHIGDGDAQIETSPEATGWTWKQQNHEGPVVETILDTAHMVKADLIAMTTKGRHGFLDLLRGTTTEQVLRRAECPVLAIPTA